MTRRYHLQLPFWIYSGLTMLVGFAALTSQTNNLLYWVFGAMLAAMLVSGIVSGIMMMNIRARRLDPKHGSVGEPLIVRYEIANRSRFFPAFNVHVEDLALEGGGTSRETGESGGWNRLMAPAEAWVMHAGPRETVHGEAIFWPQRRGEARFESLRIRTTFPFGIVNKSITLKQRQHTLIYPRVYALKPGVLNAVGAEGPLGTKLAMRPGSGDEYFGVREYRAGDSMRHIAWKRAAGLDDLVTVQHSRPSPPRLRVVLDLTRPTDDLRLGAHETITARDLEEQAISLAASFIYGADRAGFEVGLTVEGVDLPAIPVRRNHWHTAKVMAALAGLDLDRPRRAARREEPEIARVGMAVIHPDRVEPSIGRAEAWHVTARQLTTLVAQPVVWQPRIPGAGAGPGMQDVAPGEPLHAGAAA